MYSRRFVHCRTRGKGPKTRGEGGKGARDWGEGGGRPDRSEVVCPTWAVRRDPRLSVLRWSLVHVCLNDPLLVPLSPSRLLTPVSLLYAVRHGKGSHYQSFSRIAR